MDADVKRRRLRAPEAQSMAAPGSALIGISANAQSAMAGSAEVAADVGMEGKAGGGGGVSGKSEGLVESLTMPFPHDLPMQYRYLEPEFYVRKCYPVYYEWILRLLYTGKQNIITVTGTPGIGKSLFYAYFFSRYSLQFPDATIVTTAFARHGDTSKMTKVVVWRGGKVWRTAKRKEDAMIDLMLEAEKDAERLIHLYDGPPDIPPDDVKMVCFTSPNDSWFHAIEKDQDDKLIMPLWDLEELKVAANELRLKMEEEQSIPHRAAPKSDGGDPVLVQDLIESRFYMFGGVARECLSTRWRFVKERASKIEEIVGCQDKIQSMKHILAMKKTELMCHRICHWVPDPSDVFTFTIAPPTKFVERVVVECLGKLAAAKRQTLMDLLSKTSEAASFCGALFEWGVHQKLSSEGSFAARLLSGGDFPAEFSFTHDKSIPTVAGEQYCFFDSDFSRELLSSGPYHVPRAKNFAAIDSFYYPVQTPSAQATTDIGSLRLFQMTVAQTHPVSGVGIARLLDRLGLMDTVEAHPERAALIFAVPTEVASRFVRQKISLSYGASDEDTVRKLDQVGDTKEGVMNAVKIYKIGDLRKRLQDYEATERGELAPDQVQLPTGHGLSLKCLRGMMAKHDEWLKKSRLERVLDSIPQYVLGVELPA